MNYCKRQYERFSMIHFVIRNIIDENDVQGLVFDDFDGTNYLAKFKNKNNEIMRLLKSISNNKHCFALGFDTYPLGLDPYYSINITHHEKDDNENIKSMFICDAFVSVSFELYNK